MGYFFLVASLILLIMQVVIGGWFYFIFPSIGWKIPLVILPVLLTIFVCFTMTYTRTHYGTFETIAYYLAYIWAGLVFMFFSLIFLFALIQFVCYLLHIPAQTILKWVSLAVLLIVTILSVRGGFSAPSLRAVPVQIPHAPRLKAAIISDSHLGVGVSLPRWQQALKRIQAEQPDIIFVLGDLFEYGPNRAAYAEALAQVATPLGVYGVLGNHEYYMGYQNSVDFYKQAGITLLQNQAVTLPNNLQIIGINDIKTTALTADKLQQILSDKPENTARILLSHQPSLTQTVAEQEIPLMLSGHTHAGQIWPFHYLVKLVHPYIYGLYQIGPKSVLYVTSGMFYWGMPLRFLAPAEIPILYINYEK